MLLTLDDQPVAGIDDLYRLLSADRIGMPCRMELLRDGQRCSIDVVPRERRLAQAAAIRFGWSMGLPRATGSRGKLAFACSRQAEPGRLLLRS